MLEGAEAVRGEAGLSIGRLREAVTAAHMSRLFRIVEVLSDKADSVAQIDDGTTLQRLVEACEDVITWWDAPAAASP